MSETRWTKGPWKVYRGGNFTEIWSAKGKPEGAASAGKQCRPNALLVGESNFRQSDTGDNTPGQSLANAHLIAAAPELYEALVECAGFVRSECPRDPNHTLNVMLRKADTALAKARGEQC